MATNPLPQADAALAFDWDAATLQRRLDAIVPGSTVEVVAQTGSTNSDLLERRRCVADAAAEPALPAPIVRVAEQQTAGRGRLGRRWWSQPGHTLTFSIGLALAPADWSGLSLAVGLAVAEALGDWIGEPPGATVIGLKWPNDLWLRRDDRKLAGILIEAQALRGAPAPEAAAAAVARWAVVGIGINLRAPRQDGNDEPGEFRSGYASLAEFSKAATPPAVLQQVAPAVLAELQRFEREGLAPRLAAYARRDVLAGRRVTAGDFTGLAEGIAPGGELLLRDDSGRRHLIGSGEVSVRPC